MENELLLLNDISKSFGEIKALDQISLTLKKGEIRGLLGPNGAGKTTLISILSGTMKDFTGSAKFMGEDLFANRRLKNHMGIVPQEMAFYDELNAYDNLLFWGGLYDMKDGNLKSRAKELLKLVELDNRAKEPIKNFSGGMKRRLNVAIGLIHKPDLILMDEPTVGIDVQAKVSILEIIKRIGEKGTSVIFTTHQLAEVEEVCSKITILDKGAILAEGTMDELIKIVGEKEIIDIHGLFTKEEVSKLLGKTNSSEVLSLDENILTLAVEKTDQVPAIMEKLIKKGIQVSDLKIKSPNLEAVFLKLTGRSLRD